LYPRCLAQQIDFLKSSYAAMILLVSAKAIPSVNVFNAIGWLTLPIAFIGPKRLFQTVANLNNPTG
jgi:hypothetical protein